MILIPLFWTSGDVCSGLKSKNRSLNYLLCYQHTVDTSDSPLWHLPSQLTYFESRNGTQTNAVGDSDWRLNRLSYRGAKLWFYHACSHKVSIVILKIWWHSFIVLFCLQIEITWVLKVQFISSLMMRIARRLHHNVHFTVFDHNTIAHRGILLKTARDDQIHTILSCRKCREFLWIFQILLVWGEIKELGGVRACKIALAGSCDLEWWTENCCWYLLW